MKILRNKYGEIRSGWDILWVSLVILFGLQFIIGFILSVILIVNKEIETSFRYFYLSVRIISEYIYIVALLIIWKGYHKESFVNLGFTHKGKFLDLTLGLVMGLFSISFVYVVLLFTNQLSIANVNFSIIHTPEYILYLIFYISVGIWEEMFTRGYFMSVLKRTRNIYAIIFIPSIVFSFLHLFNPNVGFIGILNIFVVGVLFSLMFYKRGSLWMPIGFHITWNFFQGNVFGLNVSGTEPYSIINNIIDGNKLLTGGDFGAEGGLITTLIVSILIIFFLLLSKEEDENLWSINIKND